MVERNERYIGEVRRVNGNYVHVSLWDSRKQETTGTFPRRYFPDIRLKTGMIFSYEASVIIQMVKPQEPSEKEIERMRSNLVKRLGHLDV
jgi:hypothetical protein